MKSVLSLHRGAVLAFACAALLAGCASTGGLHPVAKPLAADSLHAERSLAGSTRDTATWPQAEWWKAAGDTQLDTLVAEALADNPDMALVDARVRGALAVANVANAERKPSLNGGASIAGARVPPILPPLASGHFGAIRFGYLSFKWNLDLWGGKRAAWQAAIGKARAAEVDAEAARLQLATTVVEAYFDLAGAYAQQAYAKDELQRAEDFRKLTQKRVANGIDSKFALARIDGETATARAQLEAADNAVHTTGLVLAALLGKGPDRALAITPPKLPAVPALALPEDLPVNLLGRRPDVVAARWRAAAAGHDIKVAKTRFLPNVSISALAGLIAPASIDLFSLGNRFYMAQPALALPIFEGGALRANLAGKDAAYDAAVAEYNHALVQAINEVATQAGDLRSLGAQLQDAQSARASTAEAYALAMQRYRAGVGSYLEVLSVRQQLITVEQQVAALETHRSVAWAALNQALGGGFKAPADVPSLVATPDSASKARR